MTTNNPWDNTGSTLWKKRWDEGYQAAEADHVESCSYKTGHIAGLKAGQDITADVITAKEEAAFGKGQATGYALGQADDNGLKSTRIRDLERQVTNLQEKNDNQRKLIEAQRDAIVEAGEQHDIDDLTLEQLRGRMDKHSIERKVAVAYEEGQQAGHAKGILDAPTLVADDASAFDEGNEAGYTDGLAEGKRQRNDAHSASYQQGIAEGKRQADSLKYAQGWTDGLVRGRLEGIESARKQSIINDKDAYERGITEGERRLEGLGSVGFDSGFIAGKEEGFNEGRDYAVKDWMMHFILYMQENEHPFAVVTIEQLEEIQEASVKLRGALDLSVDAGAHLEAIEDILVSLEDVTR